jgi:hypothetical protein
MQTIGIYLVQQIYKVIFSKLSQYSCMLQDDVVRSSGQRDQDIRFDAQSGEKEDKDNEFFLDQYAHYGEDCVNKNKNEGKKEHAKKVKILEQYILEFFKNESYLPAGIKNDMSSKFGLDEAGSNDAIISREWRIFDFCIENYEKFALAMGI